MSTSAPPPHFCLLGGGIMSLTTAYYLLTSPSFPAGARVTLVENSRAGIAAAASSYAAGFLAGGADVWQAAPSQDLARLSWKCHVALAEQLGGKDKWGFREEPGLFCRALHAHCSTLGLATLYGEPTSLTPSTPSSPSRTLQITPHAPYDSPISLSATSFLVAAGPWSAALCRTLNLPPIPLTNLPGHSIILRPFTSIPLPATAIFAGISGGAVGVHASTSGAARSLTLAELGDGYTKSPEAFTRPDGTVYVAGENSIPSTAMVDAGLPNRLPKNADGVEALKDENLVKRLVNAAAAISPALNVGNGAVVERSRFCYRPITPDGEPMIGQLEPGVFIATGHGPWGITLAPGTGKVVSELLLGNETSADISGLSPQRFSSRKASL
ncbi:hypothetical protein RQP46_004479 [Phenoliferia psychrophenolica]